jgi:ribonuclease BN (tRNA processing enzyme)
MRFNRQQILNYDCPDTLAQYLAGRRRILIWGAMGTGKSTLSMALARLLSRHEEICQILELDPGRPPFGVPGAVCRGWWTGERFDWTDIQALCSLDAARFRLPLVLAVRHLVDLLSQKGHTGPIVIDPPGVARGAGGAELLLALASDLAVDAVVICIRENASVPLEAELSSLAAELICVPASPAAKRPSKGQRNRYRTRLWDQYLTESAEIDIAIDQTAVLGTPPPRHVSAAWTGRQAALLDATGRTLVMGEVVRLTANVLRLRTPPGISASPAAVLIRDAGRNPGGDLETFAPVSQNTRAHRVPLEMLPPAVTLQTRGTPVSTRVGSAWATLVGGVFGDPLLHVRLRHIKQSYLFDLGEPSQLATKAAHQVKAVFLSHAHLDHIGGFPWFLRTRIGFFGPCKIFGPAETCDRIAGFIHAVTWDRIRETAPLFEVCEIHGDRLKRALLQPGRQTVELPVLPIENGIVLKETHFNIRAAVCDHGVASVAYALEFRGLISIDKEALAAAGLTPGPWLGRLKNCVDAGTPDVRIALPDGTAKTAGELAEALTESHPGQKLVYAADAADTPENREKLIALAHNARTLFCETAFTRADKARADANQHLTTAAAVDIARMAGVDYLVPFHFSKRYEHSPGTVYNELMSLAGPVGIIGPFYRDT